MTNCVDLTNLRAATDGDVELERELFDEYVSSSVGLIAQLEEAPDNESWRKAAHALKGISGNLGAMPLANLCKEGQEISDSTSPEKAALLAQIKEEHSKVLDFLSAQG